MTNSRDPGYFASLAESMRMRSEHGKEDRTDTKDTSIVVHTLLCAEEIELLIREFNPSKNTDLYAIEWIREIEALGRIHQWDSAHLILYATMRMSGVARVWYEYALEHIKDWEDFKTELLMNFPRTIDAADVHSQLVNKKRRANETLEEYFHTIVQLAKKIKLPDDSIKDYFIRGIQEPKHQMILSAMGSCSLPDMLRHMQRLENDMPARDVEQNEKERNSAYPKSPVQENPPSHSERDKGEQRQRYEERTPGYPSERKFIPAERRQNYRENSFYQNKRNPHFYESPRSHDFNAGTAKFKDKTRDKACFACGADDHLLVNCPMKEPRRTYISNPPMNAEPRKSCYICNSEDHLARFCPDNYSTTYKYRFRQ